MKNGKIVSRIATCIRTVGKNYDINLETPDFPPFVADSMRNGKVLVFGRINKTRKYKQIEIITEDEAERRGLRIFNTGRWHDEGMTSSIEVPKKKRARKKTVKKDVDPMNKGKKKKGRTK